MGLRKEGGGFLCVHPVLSVVRDRLYGGRVRKPNYGPAMTEGVVMEKKPSIDLASLFPLPLPIRRCAYVVCDVWLD